METIIVFSFFVGRFPPYLPTGPSEYSVPMYRRGKVLDIDHDQVHSCHPFHLRQPGQQLVVKSESRAQ